HYLGRLTPAGGVTEFATPESVNGLTRGPDGALWLTEGDSRLGVVVDVDANQRFIRSVYVHALGRAPAAAELQTWEQVLLRSGSTAVVAGIERSAEAFARRVTEWFTDFRYLDRPTPPSAVEIQPYVNA